MINDTITASIAAAAKYVLLGESPEGPRSEGEKEFVALHKIQLLEPPSDPKAEESPKAPDSTEKVKKADEPQDAEVLGQDKPVKDPSKVETPMTESADECPCCEPISQDEITEVLSKNAPASDWIHDFVNSDDPRFAGKSKEERIKMALGAYYGAQNESLLAINRDNKSIAEANKKISVGDKVQGIQGVDGGYSGKVKSIKKDNRGKTLVTFIDDKGKERETFDFNVKKLNEADEGLEADYKKLSSDSARESFLKKKGIPPGISTLRGGDVKLIIKNELNGKKTIYATDTEGKLIAISGTASSPSIRYVK
jgi:hypothetical protein